MTSYMCVYFIKALVIAEKENRFAENSQKAARCPKTFSHFLDKSDLSNI